MRRAYIGIAIVALAAVVLLGDVFRPGVEVVKVRPLTIPLGPETVVRFNLRDSVETLGESPSVVLSSPSVSVSGPRTQRESEIVGELCIKSIEVTANPTLVLEQQKMRVWVDNGLNELDQVYPISDCALQEHDEQTGSTNLGSDVGRNQEPFTLPWFSRNGASYFPFDVWETDVYIYSVAVEEGNDVSLIAPSISLTSIADTWDVSAQREAIRGIFHDPASSAPVTGHISQLTLTLHRPLSVRLFTAFLLLALLALEIGIYFIGDQGATIGVIVGVIFGLWSIHEVLVPDGVPAINLVRSIILFLYVVLVVMAFMRFFVKPLLETPDTTDSAAPAAAEPSEVASLDHRTD